jgi:hypothetical protein
MDRRKKNLLWISLLGGIAVLGSYALGLVSHPGQGTALWGGVPQYLRVINIVSMSLAALGWLIFTSYLLFVLDLETARISLGAGFKAFSVLSAAVLIPSALWMPITFAYLAHPGSLVWLADRLVLILTGLASLGLLSALLNIQPRKPVWSFWLAFTGCVLFCIQTALMDALIWTNFFPI